MKGIGKIGSRIYYVLQVQNLADAGYPCRGVVFRVSGDKISKEEEIPEAALSSCLEQIPGHAGVLLQLMGDDVLSRYSHEESDNLFEEIQEDDFYLDLQHSSRGITLQSACRKTTMDPIVEMILASGKYVLDVSLSTSSLLLLEGIVDSGQLYFGHLLFDFKEESLIDIRDYTDEVPPEELVREFQLGEETYDQDALLALAFLTKMLVKEAADYPLINGQTDQWRYYRLYRMTGLIALITLFLSLLLNFLLFGQGREKLVQLKSTGSDQLMLVTEIERLRSQMEEYSSLQIEGPASANETFSFYLEELAGSRVNGLWFDRLQIHPAGPRMEKGKAVIPHENEILLSGETRGAGPLNDLIENLKAKAWVADVEVRHYEKSEENDRAEFQISIDKR